MGLTSSRNGIVIARKSSLININCCSGDGDRANEQPGLTSLHTVFVRLHNKFEAQIAALPVTSSWSGERLYQETRRIVIAVYQAIVFNEFMPLVLGVDEFQRLFGVIMSFDDGRGTCSYAYCSRHHKGALFIALCSGVQNLSMFTVSITLFLMGYSTCILE